MPEDKRWDYQYASANRNRKDLIAGIVEMAEVTGLAADLPIDLKSTLTALFAYRNKMFHHGFEWPDDIGKPSRNGSPTKAGQRIGSAKATSGGKPWIFYLTDVVVDHCLATVEQIFDGLGPSFAAMTEPHPTGPCAAVLLDHPSTYPYPRTRSGLVIPRD